MKKILFFQLTLVLASCGTNENSTKGPKLFDKVDDDVTGIHFSNDLDYTEELNTYTYRSFYNGAGVAVGDINNDGLIDLFFAGNLVDNKLYLNRGNWKFEDISQNAGVTCTNIWSSGVSMVDVNGDGLIDIYVCKSGPPGGKNRYNELFINNGNLTFKEMSAEYGLHDEGFSTHACFFDYDNDGDLDFYLLNNSMRSVGGYDLRPGQRDVRDPDGGNKLYRNELSNGRMQFTDVSEEAGIFTSAIGFGLGATVGDINRDGWQDIFVSNDFFERDYLYINQKDGSFKEALEDYMGEISLSSMGADMADMNNDGYPEIYVTDMLPWTDARIKTKTAFDSWDKYSQRLDNGYYRQFTRNTLQLNNAGRNFSEISRYAGVAATDWSWGALLADFDNDGWKDIFVANGIYKDLTDQDYINFMSDPSIIRKILKEEGQVIKQLIDSIPSEKVPNCAFRNTGTLRFESCDGDWGLDEPSFSNGAAYADFDNDGDLDLAINNVNMPAHIYENKSNEIYPERHYLSIQLAGPELNTFGLGAQITVETASLKQYQNHMPMKSYQSTTDHRILFGTGPDTIVKRISVQWHDGRITELLDIPVDGQILIAYEDATDMIKVKKQESSTLFQSVDAGSILAFNHVENKFVDFDRDRLAFFMKSNEGPCMCKGDVNGDGLEDVYLGGAKGSSAYLFIQNSSGSFSPVSDPFELDSESEDTDCAFFDANGNGFRDLYVTSGGNEFSNTSIALQDRLYINNGSGAFSKSAQRLPTRRNTTSSTVAPADFDNDGDIDLFVGTRLRPFLYGTPVDGYLLENHGGEFKNITAERAPGLTELGMITDASWADFDADGDLDLVVIGEWMSVHIFLNDKGYFTDQTQEWGLGSTSGLWKSIAIADLNHDGKPDLVVGNLGLNSRLKASENEPLELWINDFDQNSAVEQILTAYNDGVSYPIVLRQDLVMQMPALKAQYLRFSNYKNQTITDIFTPEQLERAIKLDVTMLESVVMLNTGDMFEAVPLPEVVQFSPVYAIEVNDFDNDGIPDIVCGGNLYRGKPELGIHDASYGNFLRGTGDGSFVAVPAVISGYEVNGEIRNIASFQSATGNVLLIARNNDSLLIFKYD
jgi:enediyne biosynthesis protein E4